MEMHVDKARNQIPPGAVDYLRAGGITVLAAAPNATMREPLMTTV